MNVNIDNLAEEMPDFHKHEDAQEWFKNKFGEKFVFKSEDVSDGERVFFYHIVKNDKEYEHYMEFLQQDTHEELQDTTAFHSYTTVEISEHGDVSLSI